jgi:hypothetical protein
MAKKKPWFKTKTIPFPVFVDFKVIVEVTSNVGKSALRRKETRKANIDERTEAFVITVKEKFTSYLVLPHNSSPGTIAHECWHIVEDLMEIYELKPESETTAYHLGYLVDEIYKFSRGRLGRAPLR